MLTVNGKAEVIVQDAAAYQKLLELVDRLQAIEGIQKGLESMVFYDRQFFFTFLGLMTSIAEAEAPFFTTVLEPSPWRTEVSS